VADPARREVGWVALWCVVLLVPFVGKAISIDAPVFVAVAHQILVHPLDPYGFQMVWDPTSPNAWVFNRNPPLLSYYLAGWIGLFGESDTLLHVAMLPVSLFAGLSFLGITRRITAAGVGPVFLLVATPAYFVLATTLMLDLPVLAFLLFGVYALLRGAEDGRPGWQLVAGFAAAAAGLTKYVGFCAAPLLAAGVWLLYTRRVPALLRVLVPPLVVWTLWGAYTAHLYGMPHFARSSDVVLGTGRFAADEFWNHVFSAPIYHGCALLFPLFLWMVRLARGNYATGLAVAGVIAGTLVVRFVLPGGEPSRRFPIEVDEATFGAFGCASALFLWGMFVRPSRLREGGIDRFLLLWYGGVLCFTMFLNWHVNAADALLAAPAAILLVWRDAELRPAPRVLAAWLAVMLPLSLLLATVDLEQANVYRSAAVRIAAEIGDRPGRRYFVGHWGLQHYLQRQGFEAVVPPQYGRSDLQIGDWVATARNVSQLDVSRNMAEYEYQKVWSWEFDSAIPLRTTNADASGGFYSHQTGYVPFAWTWKPLDTVTLGRVVAVKARASGAP